MIDVEGDNTFVARVITMVVDGQAQVAPGAENRSDETTGSGRTNSLKTTSRLAVKGKIAS